MKQITSMKRTVRVWAMVVITGMLAMAAAGCNGQSPSGGSSQSKVENKTIYQKLDPVAYYKKMQETPSYVLLDVRTPGEYAGGHIEGAMLIDYYDDAFSSKIEELPRDKPVFIYCHSGNRSGKASRILQDAGFTEIYDLKGGISGWQQMGLPVVQP